MTDMKENKGHSRNDDNNVISSGSADRVGGQKVCNELE